MVQLTNEEILAILNFFDSDYMEDAFFDKDVMNAVKKMAENIDKKIDIRECLCGSCYHHGISDHCPECGELYDNIEIGTKIKMPFPYDHDCWNEGEACVVTGFEEIDGDSYAIVLGEDGRSWCVLRGEVNKYEDIPY